MEKYIKTLQAAYKGIVVKPNEQEDTYTLPKLQMGYLPLQLKLNNVEDQTCSLCWKTGCGCEFKQEEEFNQSIMTAVYA